MKQKIVLKVHMPCEKCRKKAMKIVVAAHGVISAAVQGNEKDELVVTGMSVDAASLTRALRKKLRYATIVTVEEVKENVKEEGKKEKEKDREEPNPNHFLHVYPPYYAIPIHDEYPSACNIL